MGLLFLKGWKEGVGILGGLYNTNPHHASEFPLWLSPLQTEHSQALLMRTQTAEVPTSHPLLFKHSPSCSNTSLLNTLSERALGLQQTSQWASAPDHPETTPNSTNLHRDQRPISPKHRITFNEGWAPQNITRGVLSLQPDTSNDA